MGRGSLARNSALGAAPQRSSWPIREARGPAALSRRISEQRLSAAFYARETRSSPRMAGGRLANSSHKNCAARVRPCAPPDRSVRRTCEDRRGRMPVRGGSCARPSKNAAHDRSTASVRPARRAGSLRYPLGFMRIGCGSSRGVFIQAITYGSRNQIS